jgi:hypothetical protein
MLERLTLEFAGTVVAALLTVMVLSYLVGDNPLFRLATHIFIGVAAGYSGAIAWHSVLWPGLVQPLMNRGWEALLEPITLVPIVLLILLLLKVSPGSTRLGSLPMALLVGVGAAVAVGGAIGGTLLPQSSALAESLNPFATDPLSGEGGLEHVVNALIMVVGALATLLYFRFSGVRSKEGAPARPVLGEAVARVGKIFIAATFGVVYAGALMAAITVLVERIGFLWNLIASFFMG